MSRDTIFYFFYFACRSIGCPSPIDGCQSPWVAAAVRLATINPPECYIPEVQRGTDIVSRNRVDEKQTQGPLFFSLGTTDGVLENIFV